MEAKDFEIGDRVELLEGVLTSEWDCSPGMVGTVVAELAQKGTGDVDVLVVKWDGYADGHDGNVPWTRAVRGEKPPESDSRAYRFARPDELRKIADMERELASATEETVSTSSEAPSLGVDPMSNSEKPPLGLSPRSFWLEDRRDEILLACNRYADAGNDIPFDWIKQLQEVERLLKEGD